MKKFILVEIKENTVFGWSDLGEHSDFLAASVAALNHYDMTASKPGSTFQVIEYAELNGLINKLADEKYSNYPVKEIDAERFQDMLEVLPPVGWRGNALFESFLMSECYDMQYRQQFMRVKINGVNRYFTTIRCAKTQLNHDNLLKIIGA
jgi:hypothetical protein